MKENSLIFAGMKGIKGINLRPRDFGSKKQGLFFCSLIP
jgi:hypothetical protein